MPTVCMGFSVRPGPLARPVEGSSSVTSTMPVSSVNRVATSCPGTAGASTSAMTIVPRMAATAFGVLISTDSPGFMRLLSTASAILPPVIPMVEVRAVSVILSCERSRTVTTALPPSRMRASDSSPIVIRSWTYTSSLNLSGA